MLPNSGTKTSKHSHLEGYVAVAVGPLLTQVSIPHRTVQLNLINPLLPSSDLFSQSFMAMGQLTQWQMEWLLAEEESHIGVQQRHRGIITPVRFCWTIINLVDVWRLLGPRVGMQEP